MSFAPDFFARARLAAWLAVLACLSGCVLGGGASEEDGSFAPPAAPAGWPRIHWPKDNPYSPAKAELGRTLFFDPRLSSEGVVSCTWCHSERASFADKHSDRFSTGVNRQHTRYNTPTLVNVAFNSTFMFAGEASTLEEQVLHPLLSPREMDMTEAGITALLSADSAYVRGFRESFGPGPIVLDRVAKALATFQRTLISHRSPYDAWKAGEDTALTPAARRGEALFMGKADCARCHVPPLFTDGRFHNTGLAGEDSGRARVTGLASDLGKFKTPTLRNLLWTRPYAHDGRFFELRDMVEHYNAGGLPHSGQDTLLKPLGLTYGEVSDILEFLGSLTDQHFMDEHAP